MTERSAVAAAATIGFLAAALATAILGVPIPQIHDEAAYLLQADTFAHGRLTNPTHAAWPHFETFYVLQQPTYQAKYQPAPAALLAIGEIAGLPIAGAWLASALACGCVTWMLIAWVPLRWAFVGGLVVALHPTTLTWGHGYWGGSVAMAGGALVIGSARRLLGRFTTLDAVLLGSGIVILANSRPFEGAVLSAATLIAAVRLRALNLRTIGAAAITVAVGLLFTGYYDWRVTGHALRLPYVEYERQYAITPALIFQSARAIHLRHDDMRKVTYDWNYFSYRDQRTIGGFARAIPHKLSMFCNAAFSILPDTLLVRVPEPRLSVLLAVISIATEIVLLIPFIWLIRLWRRDRLIRHAIGLLLAGFVFALAPTVAALPHYAAPFAPLLLIMWVAGVRQMPAPRAVLALFSAVGIIGIVLWASESKRALYRWPEVEQRLQIAKRIAEHAGSHLVLVRYTAQHQTHFTWIQNLADIDAQRIVWARDLGDNTALLRYFSSRAVWLVIAGDAEPRVILLKPQAQQKEAESRPAPAGVPTS